MLIENLLSSVTEDFCLEQFEEYIKDPTSFQKQARAVIDAHARPTKDFLFGLNAHMGIEAILGATVMLALLLHAEEKRIKSGIS